MKHYKIYLLFAATLLTSHQPAHSMQQKFTQLGQTAAKFYKQTSKAVIKQGKLLGENTAQLSKQISKQAKTAYQKAITPQNTTFLRQWLQQKGIKAGKQLKTAQERWGNLQTRITTGIKNLLTQIKTQFTANIKNLKQISKTAGSQIRMTKNATKAFVKTYGQKLALKSKVTVAEIKNSLINLPEKTAELFQSIKAATEQGFTQITEALKTRGNAVKTMLENSKTRLNNVIDSIQIKSAQSLKEAVSELNSTKSNILNNINSAQASLKNGAEQAQKTLKIIFEKDKATVQKALNAAEESIATTRKTITTILEKDLATIKDLAGKTGEAAKSALTAAKKSVSESITKLEALQKDPQQLSTIIKNAQNSLKEGANTIKSIIAKDAITINTAANNAKNSGKSLAESGKNLATEITDSIKTKTNESLKTIKEQMTKLKETGKFKTEEIKKFSIEKLKEAKSFFTEAAAKDKATVERAINSAKNSIEKGRKTLKSILEKDAATLRKATENSLKRLESLAETNKALLNNTIKTLKSILAKDAATIQNAKNAFEAAVKNNYQNLRQATISNAKNLSAIARENGKTIAYLVRSDIKVASDTLVGTIKSLKQKTFPLVEIAMKNVKDSGLAKQATNAFNTLAEQAKPKVAELKEAIFNVAKNIQNKKEFKPLYKKYLTALAKAKTFTKKAKMDFNAGKAQIKGRIKSASTKGRTSGATELIVYNPNAVKLHRLFLGALYGTVAVVLMKTLYEYMIEKILAEQDPNEPRTEEQQKEITDFIAVTSETIQAQELINNVAVEELEDHIEAISDNKEEENTERYNSLHDENEDEDDSVDEYESTFGAIEKDLSNILDQVKDADDLDKMNKLLEETLALHNANEEQLGNFPNIYPTLTDLPKPEYISYEAMILDASKISESTETGTTEEKKEKEQKTGTPKAETYNLNNFASALKQIASAA